MNPTVALGYAPLLRALSPCEIHFLKLPYSDLTYLQIAAAMQVSPRTVDGYREELFEKLNVRSRVGLALWAVKVGLVVL